MNFYFSQDLEVEVHQENKQSEAEQEAGEQAEKGEEARQAGEQTEEQDKEQAGEVEEEETEVETFKVKKVIRLSFSINISRFKPMGYHFLLTFKGLNR